MSTVRFLSRCFFYGGASGAGLASFVSLFGIIGVIVTTPALCPESLGADRCRNVARNGAGLASYGLVAAGAFSVLAVGGRLAIDADPEA
jgi:hypothetical protein